MDVTTIERKTRTLFGDPGSIIFSQTELIDWINDAQMQIARESSCLTGQTTANASTFPVAYPSGMIRLKRCLYGTFPLTECPLDDLDARRLDLTTQSTPLFFYFVNNTIALFPDPTSTDTTTVTLQYSKTPTVLATSADPLTIPDHYHEDVVRFCVMRAHEKNENYRAMEIKKSEFDQMKAQRNSDYQDPSETYPVKRDDPYDPSWWIE